MSTSPETRTDDRLITLISRWLARHAGNAELRNGLAEIGVEGLEPGQIEAVQELREQVERTEPGKRGELEMIARETLEAFVLGE